jgi:hypothetical protein
MKKFGWIFLIFLFINQIGLSQYLGDFAEDSTVHFVWYTNGTDGAAITRSTDGTITVFKDGATSGTTKGVTGTEDFNSVTGIHSCHINTAVSAFYVAGADYSVVLSGATVDSISVAGTLREFSIENRFDEVDVVKVGGEAVAIGTGPLSTTETASAVWDTLVADHAGATTFGGKNQFSDAEIATELLGTAIDGAVSLQIALARILSVTVNNTTVTIADPNILIYGNSAGNAAVVTHTIPRNGTSRTAEF